MSNENCSTKTGLWHKFVESHSLELSGCLLLWDDIIIAPLEFMAIMMLQSSFHLRDTTWGLSKRNMVMFTIQMTEKRTLLLLPRRN